MNFDSEFAMSLPQWDSFDEPAVGTPTDPVPVYGSVLTNNITWGTQLSDNTITVYFAPRGYTTSSAFGIVESEGFNSYEVGQFQHAFDAIEAVIDVNFVIVSDPLLADLTFVSDTNEVDGLFLGIFSPPGTFGAGIGVFDGAQWDRAPGGDLEVGGFGYVTIVHELLHGLGLAHPHDDGGSSTIMPGVEDAFGDFGDHNLNQGVYTTMSYNSGYLTGPAGTAPSGSVGTNYGFEAGPMAIDIAVLQAIYGANTTHASGNDVYVLPTGNSLGSYWQSIWDTGGTDEIRHNGTNGATIDLRPATLENTDDGGGLVSHENNTPGGFTIAHGVLIENATGGSGGDLIEGNSLRNVLNGRQGDDTIYGEQGFDLLYGGSGNDVLDGGSQADNIFGQAGDDTLYGGSGFDRLFGGDGDDLARGGSEGDGLFGGAGDDTLIGEAGDDRLFGEIGNELLLGGTDDDLLGGGAGFDTLIGGEGDDLLMGNFNADRFVFSDGHGNDTIGDFADTNIYEKIDLSGVSAIVNMYDLLLNHTTQVGANVVIDTGSGDSITLNNVNLSNLDHSDFVF